MLNDVYTTIDALMDVYRTPLTAKQRRVLTLTAYGYEQAEIGTVMGITRQAVGRILSRARRRTVSSCIIRVTPYGD